MQQLCRSYQQRFFCIAPDLVLESITKLLVTAMDHSAADPESLFNINDLMLRTKQRLLCSVIEVDGRTLRFEPCSHPLWIKCVPRGIEQVLLNLAINARDATPHKGTITLAATRVSITLEDLAHHPDARVGRFACISVSDNGCGISTKDLPHIFEPFFFASKEKTGLGLWCCRETVRECGGWIEVRTRLEHGSTFLIFLPEVDPPN